MKGQVKRLALFSWASLSLFSLSEREEVVYTPPYDHHREEGSQPPASRQPSRRTHPIRCCQPILARPRNRYAEAGPPGRPLPCPHRSLAPGDRALDCRTIAVHSRRTPPMARTARIEALRQEIEHSTGVQKLAAAQKLVDIQRAEPAKNELPALEAEFIKVALDYSEGHGISYTAWRQVGVSAKTLKAAGITT